MLTHFKMCFDIDLQCLVSNYNEEGDKNSVTKFHVKKLSGKYKAPIRLPATEEDAAAENPTYLTIHKAPLFLKRRCFISIMTFELKGLDAALPCLELERPPFIHENRPFLPFAKPRS